MTRPSPPLFVYGSLMHPKYWRGVVGVRGVDVESEVVRLRLTRLLARG